LARSGRAYIGVMSGTSADGIDACLAAFTGGRPRLLGVYHQPYPDALRAAVLDAIDGRIELAQAARLDARLAETYADAVEGLLAQTERARASVRAIGCHGQTVWHGPGDRPHPTTVQLGDPHRLAVRTGIDVVADLRRADLADGGQGAPLTPGFHAYAFADMARPRAVVNIGGIANITVIGAAGRWVRGFDTGPGNALMDGWAQAQGPGPFDAGGRWAASGRVVTWLLAALLADPYFARPPPKSTGRERFNQAWLERALAASTAPLDPADVQATLAELTARSIADALAANTPAEAVVYVCGGGARNDHLLQRLRDLLGTRDVASTRALGIAPEHVEALAFAWLAQRRVRGLPGNRPEVTGARRPLVLGSLIQAPHWPD